MAVVKSCLESAGKGEAKVNSETENKWFIRGIYGTGAQATYTVQTVGSLMFTTRQKKLYDFSPKNKKK